MKTISYFILIGRWTTYISSQQYPVEKTLSGQFGYFNSPSTWTFHDSLNAFAAEIVAAVLIK